MEILNDHYAFCLLGRRKVKNFKRVFSCDFTKSRGTTLFGLTMHVLSNRVWVLGGLESFKNRTYNFTTFKVLVSDQLWNL